jgi:hypothetical protein
MKTQPWSFDQAILFVRMLEQTLAPIYHVALFGSVLQRGWSNHDLDVMILPHNATELDETYLREQLKQFGMRLVISAERVHTVWRSKGSTDTKHVEIYRYDGKRVDVFLPWKEN